MFTGVSAPGREIDLARYGYEGARRVDEEAIRTGDRFVGAAAVPGGPSVLCYADLRASEVLRVNLHGAVRAEDSYPRFDRISSSASSSDAFISFADPTLTLNKDMTLGWYLGAAKWDPVPVIAEVVRRSAVAVGAKTTVLIGGSGGGFAALRLGLALKDALVYCFNPQTRVAAYYAGAVERYTTAALDSSEELVGARFDMVSAYAEQKERPRVYYAQNLSDSFHVQNHYLPFKRGVGISCAQGVSADGRVRMVLYDSEREGHAPPSATEFAAQLRSALDWYGQAP